MGLRLFAFCIYSIFGAMGFRGGIRGGEQMTGHTPEQESALLDLDSLTVLLTSCQENPFQDVGAGQPSAEAETVALPVEPDEWLED